jgi:hypothetical protein
MRLASVAPEAGDEFRARVGTGVTPVRECVHIGRHARLTSRLEQRGDVVDVGMHPAVGDQPEQMEPAAARAHVLEQPHQRAAPEKIPGLDGDIDARQVLEHHPPGADVHVAHFRVPHDPFGQADRRAVRGEQRRGEFRAQPGHVLRRRHGDGVVGEGPPLAPAVENDEERGLQRGFRHEGGFYGVRVLGRNHEV